MTDPNYRRIALLSLALLLVGVGVAVGAWNEWVTQSCLAQEHLPGTYADCADGLTWILRFGAVGMATAGVGLLTVTRRGD